MANTLCTVNAAAVRHILEAHPRLPLTAVDQAYRSHDRGETANPPSAFLPLPANRRRVIALQAATSDPPAVGCKLIASWPENILHGRPRASAIIVINDAETGVPVALLEGGQISSARTAAAAVLGARTLANPAAPAKSLAVVGAGVIAARIIETFAMDGWMFERVGCFDLEPANTAAFMRRVEERCGWVVESLAALEAALDFDIVVFATTALKPYVAPPEAFRPGQLVLNVSLRDIAPELLLGAENVVDDVEHCLTAGTSPHLAEQLIGDRRFVTGTLAQVMTGAVSVDHARPIVFSPFGMGILDLTLGHAVWQHAEAEGLATYLDNFMGGNDRWD
jgi:2,3-diaminopropionate biosynthesis protein SbnB